MKRLVVGRPLPSDRLGEQLLPKRIALPVFASDPLSSVAYATQEIMLVLTLGGLSYLFLAPWIGLAVIVLLAVVVMSYRQVVRAYPSGGGSYEVATGTPRYDRWYTYLDTYSARAESLVVNWQSGYDPLVTPDAVTPGAA